MIKELAETYLFNRHPIKVTVRFEGVPIPHVCVLIKNQTPEFIVHIHSVRIHYGTREKSLAFVLHPSDKVSIEPKDKREWTLEYEPEKPKIVRRTLIESPPPHRSDDSGPGFDSPATLFDAIGKGKTEESWIEVDFNEYDDRVFLKGAVSEIFDAVGKATREQRKQKG